jgi:signal transduction histidine kinase
MFYRGIKTNIFINIAVLLVLAMILIDFVIIVAVKNILIRSEISKGYFLISSIENELTNFDKAGEIFSDLDLKDNLNKMLSESGFSCAVILDRKEDQIYSGGNSGVIKNEIKMLTIRALQSREKITEFLGTTWGVFWKQSRFLIISAPLSRGEDIVAGAGVALQLEGIYSRLRYTQRLIFIYILVNAVIFTFFGLYRLSKVTVKPLNRLIKRANEYREDDELFFLSEKGDNEFNNLSKSLNSMLKRISEDKDRLQKTIKSLEKANFDLKQAQEDIIRAEKLASVGRLSSGIAHEIGNPVSIIIGYLDLLKKNNINDEERREFIDRAENEINRINNLIGQLLDFSRPLSICSKVVSVHEIINDIAKALKYQPILENIILELNLSASIDTVMADPDQLRQVFLNLIINAADAINSINNKSDGKIIIKSESISSKDKNTGVNPAKLNIELIDNGPGISGENINNIFDPFFTTKEPGKGTGLGLSVCFMIIDKLGGNIKATSKQEKGTTITITLPLYSKPSVSNCAKNI